MTRCARLTCVTADGALEGREKRACSEEYGLQQVQKWRRGIRDRPPESHESIHDRRYDGVEVPRAEALCDCAERLRPFLEDELYPEMRDAVQRQREANEAGASGGAAHGKVGQQIELPTFVVVSSENLLRAMVQVRRCCVMLRGTAWHDHF
jgi:hypothetical protein